MTEVDHDVASMASCEAGHISSLEMFENDLDMTWIHCDDMIKSHIYS